jgi:ParB family chromosome partitioning protein
MQKVETISPKDCTRWALADRAAAEFGDIIELAEDIKRHGQIEPVIVRPSSIKPYKYEVIAGSRRWKACLEADLPLRAIIQPLTDNQAIIAQIRENEKLKLSDYSKGISYKKMIDSGSISLAELSLILGYSKAKLIGFLNFANVPDKIWQAVNKLDKISSRSASTIYYLSKKGEDYIEALIDIADRIRLGAGGTEIERLVKQQLQNKASQSVEDDTILNPNGQILATWKKDAIVFSKNVKIDKLKFSKLLVEFLKN